MKTKTSLPSFKMTTIVTVDTEADVEIDPDELHDVGWHHESECGGRAVVTGLGTAVASLHRQAHPSQPGNVFLCCEEPCRSLTMEQLDEVNS